MAELPGEPEIEVDEATAAAIQRGIQAADDGQVVPSEEVREHVRRLLISGAMRTDGAQSC